MEFLIAHYHCRGRATLPLSLYIDMCKKYREDVTLACRLYFRV